MGESLKEVKIYNNYRIDHFAFHSCSNLSSLTLDSNLKEIGFAAFKDCTALEYVQFESNSILK